MKVNANAKINLTLDVVKRREDNYHELDMIMLPLSLCDVLDVTISDKDLIVCDTTMFPLDESNTIYKAIKLMTAESGRNATTLRAMGFTQVYRWVLLSIQNPNTIQQAKLILKKLFDLCFLG